MQKCLINPLRKRTSRWLQKAKNGSPYLYILIFAKYSTEYLAYYVYVHESMTKQVLMRFSDRAFFQ